LAEYAAAQESAQHHDNLIWTTTGIIWAGNFVLLGFIANAVSTGYAGAFVPLASLLGLLLTGSVWRMVFVWKQVMNVKYQRCRELEVDLQMHQHRDVEAVYPRAEMRIWYSIVSTLFLLAWSYFLVRGLCR
jgi:hypothetical protein